MVLIALFLLLLATMPACASNHSAGDWQANFRPDGTPKPLDDPADSTIWPNKWSRANSDEWIVKNHDRIRQMKPRILMINFSNEVDPAKPMRLANDLIAALRECSRYHGYGH